MRILVSSNGHWTPTGYGSQAKSLINSLVELGHEVAMHAWFGLEGGLIQTGKSLIYPRLRHAYGGDGGVLARHFEADLVISLLDIWVLPVNFADTLPCPWIAWFPVDGEPLNQLTKDQAMRSAEPVVFSRFARRLFEKENLPVTYIPHSVDTSTFRPLDRDALRKKHNVPEGTFLVTMVAANKGYPSRKALPECIMAFRDFQKAVPNSKLYLHTEVFPKAEGIRGIDLYDVMKVAGLDHEEVIFPDQEQYMLGLADAHIAEVYNISDVLLSPSYGEGFGLPILEAQACGTPVITQDCTSMSELTVNGISIPRGQETYNPLGTFHFIPRVGDITDALVNVHGWNKNKRDMNSRNGVEWSKQFERKLLRDTYWLPLLDRWKKDLTNGRSHSNERETTHSTEDGKLVVERVRMVPIAAE